MFRAVGRCRRSNYATNCSGNLTSSLKRSNYTSNGTTLVLPTNTTRNKNALLKIRPRISSCSLSSPASSNACPNNDEKMTNITCYNTNNSYNINKKTLVPNQATIALSRASASSASLLMSSIPHNNNFYNKNNDFLYRTLLNNICIRNISSSSIDNYFLNNDHDHDHDHNNKNVITIRSFSTKSSNSGTASNPSSDTTNTATTSNASSKDFSTVTTTNTSASSTTKNITQKIKCVMKSATKAIVSFLASTPGVVWYYITHPTQFKEKLRELLDHAKKEAHHYYMGSKLLIADIRTAKRMLFRLLQGSTLTRRERKQLIRTTTDLFRLVPFSIFLIIPFMEFALPFALKLFPNMLPSTFQDSLKEEEKLKKELQSRIAMAGFFQETLQSLAKEGKQRATTKRKQIKKDDKHIDNADDNDNDCIEEKREETAASFLKFLEQARKGDTIPPDVIIKYATYFRDDLTMDNMSRMQLINMCKYMDIPPYGADSLLRFQLRHKVKSLKEDDQRILWEGIESLTIQELREACRERGMRSTGLKKEGYKKALQEWLDISVNKNVPVTLLIMSRTFFLQEPTIQKTTPQKQQPIEEDNSMVGIADAISGFEKDVINEVVLEAVSSSAEGKKDYSEYTKLKLESLKSQNELIDEEYELRKQERMIEEQERLEKEEKERLEKEEKEKELAAAAAAATANAEAESGESKDVAETTKEDVITFGTKETIDDTKTIADPTINTDGKVTITEKEKDEIKEKEEEEEEDVLSVEEMEAISQLISPNAVTSEREEFERLKAAMSEKEDEVIEKEEADEVATTKKLMENATVIKDDMQKQQEQDLTTKMDSSEIEDSKAAKIISDMDAQASKIADESTYISLDGKDKATTVIEEEQEKIIATKEKEEAEIATKEKEDQEEEEIESEEVDTKLEVSISRLQSSVEAMVGKIERQLTDVEKKIGDKLHLLDKDADGVISKEEMTVCLRSVLKRNLTQEEAMAIADDMDENEDGEITVAELAAWIDTNKFVQLAEEGRDSELDREIEKKRIEKYFLEEKDDDNNDTTLIVKDDNDTATKK